MAILNHMASCDRLSYERIILPWTYDTGSSKHITNNKKKNLMTNFI